MTARDMTGLSDRVRQAALIELNGEVLWPFEIAADAINELSDTGHRVLGLDARERHDAGLVTEVALSASTNSADIEQARAEALAALAKAEAITGWSAPNILITW